MRITFFIVFFLCLKSFVLGQDEIPRFPFEQDVYNETCNKRSDLGMKSKSYIRYVLDKGSVTNISFTDRIIKFNDNGTINEIALLDNQEKINYIFIYEYDNDLLQRIKTFSSSGETMRTTGFSYNSENLLTRKTTIDHEFLYREESVYERSLNNDTLTEYRNSNGTESVFKYVLDVDARYIASTIKYNGDQIQYFIEHVCPESQKLRDNYFTTNNEHIYTEYYFYNHLGNLVKKTRESKTGSQLQRYIYQYNDYGLLNAYKKYGSRNETLEYYKIKYLY